MTCGDAVENMSKLGSYYTFRIGAIPFNWYGLCLIDGRIVKLKSLYYVIHMVVIDGAREGPA